MSRRGNKILQNIVSICEECSGSEEDENEVIQDEDEIEILESDESMQAGDSSDIEKENHQKFGLRRKRMRILSDSESENETSIRRSFQNSGAVCDTEIAVNGKTWTKLKVGGSNGRHPFHTIFKDIAGPTGYAKRNVMEGSVSSAFHLIITKKMIEHIKSCTEEEAGRVLKGDWKISTTKLLAFIGILYARGAYEANSLNAFYLWSKEWGPAFFSNTMSRDDFMQILRFVRFDKKTERSRRLRTDKFAMISEIWNQFIYNSQCCYKPHENISIDEQLFPTKARCKFTQYMPNKPHKFGIKFWLAVDVQSKYVINGIPYLGKDETRNSTPLGEFVVMKLAEPYPHHGRNITTDNFFTSFPLAEKLVAKGTSLVGTIRANKRELPKPAKIKKDKMKLYSSEHYKSGNCILTIYKSKPNLKVLLLSTKHTFIKIKDNKKHTPETIAYYNKTKFGVDVVDQMARKYTSKSASFRWPLQVFFNILDLAAINAWILYTECTGSKLSRKEFLFQLAKELTEGEKKKSNNIDYNHPLPSTSGERRTCQIGFCKRNRSNNICKICQKVVCGKCTNKIEYLCQKCAK